MKCLRCGNLVVQGGWFCSFRCQGELTTISRDVERKVSAKEKEADRRHSNPRSGAY